MASVRSGSTLALVVLAVALLTGAAVALKGYSSQVHRRVVTDLAGDLAAVLGRAALEEAHAAACAQANRPGSPLFSLLRSGAPGADVEPFRLALPEAAALSARPPYRDLGFEVEAESRVLHRVAVAGEARGVVAHRAVVRSGGVSRTFECRRQYRATLLSVPRPFDRSTLFLMDARPLFAKRDDSPGSFAETASAIGGVWAEMRRRFDRLGTDLGIAGFPRFASAPSQILNALAADLRALEEQRFAISTYGEEGAGYLALGALDWWSVLRADAGAITALALRISTALTDLRAGRAGATALDAVIRDMAQLEKLTMQTALTISQLRAQFTLVPGGPAREGIEAGCDQLKPEAWVARAHLVVDAGTGASLTEYLARFGHPQRPFSGVLHWRGRAPLSLRNMRLSGRLVIVADGDVEVGEFNTDASGADLVTIVSRGRLRVTGRVRASLVATGELELTPEASILGNLIATGPMPRFTGALAYDPRLSAGAPGDTSPAALAHTHVSIAPGASVRLAGR